MKIVGNKLMAVCEDCGKIVTVNKTFLGDLHICTLPEERREYRDQIKARVEWAKRQLANT